MAEVFSSDTMYDIREFLEVVDENFRLWNEFTANPYSPTTAEGMNKYEKGWLSGDNKSSLWVCVFRLVRRRVRILRICFGMCWRVLVCRRLCCGLWVVCLWNKRFL